MTTLSNAVNVVVTKPYMKKVTTNIIFFDKHLAVTDETTKCEKCTIVYHTTYYEDNLTSEKHLDIEEEQQSKIKFKRKLCVRTVKWLFWENLI